jgi:sRNA-binding carbon storage regulator CsrA
VIEVRAIVDARHVRIAIEAPRQVPFHCSEVYDAVSAANPAATRSEETLLEQGRLRAPSVA